MADPKYTCEQLETLIAAALDNNDLEAVEHALHYMALVCPHRAEIVIEAIKVGLSILAGYVDL